MAEQLQNKLEHPCFPQPEDGSVRIWRYLDLAKFIWLLEKQKLYLSRLDSLNDRFEGSTHSFLLNDGSATSRIYYRLTKAITNSTAWKRDRGAQTRRKRSLKLTSKFLRIMKVKYRPEKCFSLIAGILNSESEAMWRSTAQEISNGIATQTKLYPSSVKSVANDFPELYIGKVTYIDYETQEFPAGNFAYPAMHKRMSFAHENEVRLDKLKPQKHSRLKKLNDPGLRLSGPLEPTMEVMYCNPYAPDISMTLYAQLYKE